MRCRGATGPSTSNGTWNVVTLRSSVARDPPLLLPSALVGRSQAPSVRESCRVDPLICLIQFVPATAFAAR